MAPKFLDEEGGIAPPGTSNLKLQTLVSGSLDKNKVTASMCLEKISMRFNPMRFGCSAPQIHRQKESG